ncbi:hypothetical protein LG288_05885 [Idiomarina seosinensis]|uniref:hypothetical protein n=1 Tax=Idiomarina seosinensis TaxID=281739 RepID=UPI00385001A4
MENLEHLKAQAAAADIAEAPPEYEAPTEEMPEEAGHMDTAPLLEAVLSGGFGILAPNWGVSAEEISQLSEHGAAVLDKYFPDNDMFNRFGAEIALVTTAAMVITPRLGTPRKKPEKKPDKIQDKKRPGTNPGQEFKPDNQVKMPEVINLD